ncbi:MAG: PAS domain S-box protein, partial [Syntrophobacteraceae bacterium]|nr:PAS domain S-box protein [Syntrophobacteraceae bacterium]
MKPVKKTKLALTAELEALRTRLAQTEALLESLLSDRMPTDASSPGDTESFIEANVALQKEIVHRKQVEETLKDTEKRFRAIFEEAAIGIALVDLEGVPITANPSLLELFGGSVDDLPPSLCNPLALRENGGEENEPPTGSRDYPVRDHHQLEKRYILKDGRLMWCQMTVSLIRDAGGTPHSAVVMLVDITKRRQTEKAL